MKKSKKGTWVVDLQCTVRKVVTCENCTKDQAESNPWPFATDEAETELLEWEIFNVTEE